MRISGSTSCRTLLIVALAGCVDALAPPAGAVTFEPPFEFGALWQQVETCSQLSGDLERVHWYVVPGISTFPCPSGECRGLWIGPHDIYLSHAAAHDLFQDDFFTVKHEMLHDLVGAAGLSPVARAGHPPVFQRCGLLRDSVGT